MRSCSLVLVLLLTMSLSGAQKERPKILGVLFNDGSRSIIEAVVTLRPLKGAPSGDQRRGLENDSLNTLSEGGTEAGPFERESDNRFARDYFATGRTYRIVGASDSARVKGVVFLGCMSMAAQVEVKPRIHFAKAPFWAADDASALPQSKRTFFVTDDPSLQLAPAHPASEKQRKQAIAIARAWFGPQKILARDMASLRADVEIVDLGPGTSRVVASFSAKNSIETNESIGIHPYFFIGRMTPGGLVKEVELPGGGAFLGATDLDGDGTADIVVLGLGYESHSYTIHSLRNGKWDYMYAADSGC